MLSSATQPVKMSTFACCLLSAFILFLFFTPALGKMLLENAYVGFSCATGCKQCSSPLTKCLSVCLSVRHSLECVKMEKHIIKLSRPHCVPIFLVSRDAKTLPKFQWDHSHQEHQIRLWWVRVGVFGPITTYIWQMVQSRPTSIGSCMRSIKCFQLHWVTWRRIWMRQQNLHGQLLNSVP